MEESVVIQKDIYQNVLQSTLPKSNLHKMNNRFISRRSFPVLFSLFSVVFYFFSPGGLDLGRVDCTISS